MILMASCSKSSRNSLVRVSCWTCSFLQQKILFLDFRLFSVVLILQKYPTKSKENDLSLQEFLIIQLQFTTQWIFVCTINDHYANYILKSFVAMIRKSLINS